MRRSGLVAVSVFVVLVIAGCGGAAAPTVAAPSAPAAPPAPDPGLPARLAAEVTGDGAFTHLQRFQEIATRNGGNRASGSPGYDQSVDDVAGRLREAGWQVETPTFDFDVFTPGAQTLAVGGTPVPGPVALTYSRATPPGGLTAPLVALADALADPTPACEAADFPPTVRGAIVVARRGVCPFTQKQQLAADAGAAAMVVVNTEAGPLNGTLGSVAEARLPVAGLSKTDGDALFARSGTPATLVLETRSETRQTRNVIAQTTTGRTDEVVMAGAHLDSVPEGPGINDNGSGSAALLETALRLGGSPPVTNAVRFAWWGAEELGLLGSEAYVAGLDLERKRDIALLLNFDMVASPNAGYFAYDGDDSDRVGAPAGPPGSAAIERRLLAALGQVGVQGQGTDFDGRSDYGPFIAAGIPAGGLFTGAEERKTPEQAARWGGRAGESFDPNYHTARDDLANLDRVAFDRNVRAIAATVGGYALDLTGPDGVPPRAQRQPR
ncbi:M28 family peptidase [Actinomycetospora sp. CA-084318]|uniref:M28 family peptidase n=1 Tax=Actinomycetospora sp. CA-084318 TaxID=3239892 RepID=UPI003D98EAFF